MFCPTSEQITEQAIALLPRGRAWQTAEAGPRPGTTIYGFWRALGELLGFSTARLCSLREEFFCFSTVEMLDLWLESYGLPDTCDPFPDLCAKVAAQGGARCEDLAAIAAASGWSIACRDANEICGLVADCGYADNAFAGNASPRSTIIITVYLAQSAAYAGAFEVLPYADNFIADRALACDPDIAPLVCVLSRVMHAHLAVEYEVVS